MSRISIKGVLIGAIIDTFSSMFVGILAALIEVIVSHLAKIPREVFHLHGVLDLALVLNGLAFSALGGYVAALLAKHDELLNGGLSSFLCLMISLLFMAKGIDHHPLFVQLLLLAAAPACGVLGGYLRVHQKNGSRSQ